MSNDPTRTDVAVIDAQIREILDLAHTGRSVDESRYAERQTELRQLMTAKAGGGRGTATAATPASVTEYASLPKSSAFTPADHADWSAALPEMLRLGLTTDQVFGLAGLMQRTAEKAQSGSDAERRAQHAANQKRTGEILTRRYGSNWRQRTDAAERHLKSAMRHDPSAAIGNWALASGERLGDRPEFISMIMELAEGR